MLYNFQKIPFTCSYLPGKSYFHMAALTSLGLVFLIIKGAPLERSALEGLAPAWVKPRRHLKDYRRKAAVDALSPRAEARMSSSLTLAVTRVCAAATPERKNETFRNYCP